jgi:hypothetical protein
MIFIRDFERKVGLELGGVREEWLIEEIAVSSVWFCFRRFVISIPQHNQTRRAFVSGWDGVADTKKCRGKRGAMVRVSCGLTGAMRRSRSRVRQSPSDQDPDNSYRTATSSSHPTP